MKSMSIELPRKSWASLSRRLFALVALVSASIAHAQPSYGISTLVSGTSNFNTPEGVTVESAGTNIYVADTLNSRVRKVTSAGAVTNLAATGFSGLAGVAVDGSGNVFVADTLNHVIKKVDSGGTVTLVAGLSGSSGPSVATATLTAARFNSPGGIATNSAGTILYIADTGNQVIRRIDIAGDSVATIAGTQGSAGTGAAQFNFPSAVALNAAATLLYVADRENHAIRRIDLSSGNALTTFAGTLGTSGSSNSPTPLFFRPRGVAVDSSGSVFVADYSNHTIRFITSGGTVSTIAGTAGSATLTNGIGAAARFNGPWGIAVDAAGNFYVGDSNNHAIRKGSVASAPTTFGTQPSTATFTIGATTSVTFTVDANGSPAPTYQWQRAAASDPTTFTNLSNGTANGLTVSGATTNTLTISGAAIANNGDQFRAVASNSAGSLSSNGATLTVNQQPAITSASGTTFVVNSPGSFSVTATGSPTPAFEVTSGTFPADWANYTTFQSTGVISGTPPNTSGSPFVFTIRASNGVGTAATQEFTLTVSTTVPPVINTQPANYTVPTGGNTATFSVSATANPAVTGYQWERQAGGGGAFFAVANGSPAGVTYTGATTSTLSISGVTSGMNGDVFRVVVNNGATTTSSGATLVVPPAFTTTANTSFVIDQHTTYEISASGNPAPNITLSSGSLPTGITFTPGIGTATLSGSTSQQGSFPLSIAASNTGGTVTQSFTFTVQQAQAPVITSASSHTFSVNQPGSFTFTANGAPAAQFTLSGASLPPGIEFNSPVLSGTPTSADNSPITFSVVATNSAGTSPTQTFTLTILGSVPTITADPANATANVGGSATFTASATGTPQPTVRWQRQPGGTTGFVDLTESGVYVGTQTSMLTVNNIEAFMNGDLFRMVARNNNNVTATSQSATLTVNIGTAFTTFAGLAQFSGNTDGTGTVARFNSPTGMAVDLSGNIYIADTANHVIRKVTPGAVVSTVAGLAGASGNADGVRTNARFNSPQAVAVDSIGNLYVADTFNHTIRVISTDGVVSTLAGAAGVSGAVDAAVGSDARFNLPSGIVLDNVGSVYVADTSNHAIRRVLSSGGVSTFAGQMGVSGSLDNVIGTSARFSFPMGLARDSNGNFYVADALNHVIRKITPSSEVTTFAGGVGLPGVADGNASTARFNRPGGLALDTSNNLYVADTLSSTLRKITPLAETTTVAGFPGSVGTTDGVGGQARFNQPLGVAVDFSGNIYVSDTRNHTIRRSGAASPPQINTQPANRTVPAGGITTFAVAASGTPAPGYQWQRQAASSPGSFTNIVNDVTFSGVNTATLTLSNVSAAMNGDQFRVIVSNGVSPAVESTVATLIIGSAPVFTSVAEAAFRAQQAGSFAVTVESNPAATFSVSDSPSWLSINATTGLLSGTPPAGAEGTYTLTLTANNGVAATQTFTLTVTPAVLPPTITTQPVAASVNQGQSATFTVAATGTAPLTYQWRRNGVTISGATGASYTIGNAQPSAAGSYTVLITNVAGNVTSSAAELIINTAPVFTSQPRAQTALAGSTVTFGTSASGSSSFAYQWRKNGTAITGATSSTLTLTGVSAADAGIYDVVVSNAIGSVISSVAQLSVSTTPSAPIVTSQPGSRVVVAGGATMLSVSATGAPAPSYQWRKNGAEIPGANGSTLAFAAAQVSDAGAYDVVVSNSSGVVVTRAATLRVIARSYAGIYLGTFSGVGDFGLYVREDNSAVLVGYLAGSLRVPIVARNLAVDDSGQLPFQQVASTGIATVNGSITIGSDGSLSGLILGAATASVSGSRISDTGSSQVYAGYYQAGAAANGTTAYAIVGAGGLAQVVVVGAGSSNGGVAPISGAGQLSLVTPFGTAGFTIDPVTGTIVGTSTIGSVATSVSGGSDAAVMRQRLVNISSRARVAGGDSVAIAGFVISGEDSKPVLIRAVGPTLGSFGLSGALASPRLELFRAQVSLGVNAGVASDRVMIDAAGVRAGAFALGNAGTDAAILTTLAPGNYTAVVSSTNNTAGVALVEVYDLSAPVVGQKMLNIATRAAVGTGDDLLIAGFVVPAGSAKRVLIRGIGPGLTPFNVSGVLAQPVLALVNTATNTTVAQNTNWSTSADAAAISEASTQVGAFGLANNDSAIIATLPPGNYTAQVTGTGTSTGVALIEVYELP